MTDLTLCAVAKQAADKNNAGYRYLDRRENATYVPFADMYKRALGVAGAFTKMGIRPGDSVAIVLPTCPEFFDIFFGTLLAGGVPVPLYPPVRLGRMDEYHERTARMLEVSNARLVCTEKRIQRILGQAVAQANPDLGCMPVSAIRPAAFEALNYDPDHPALIQFSSGTTVDPKPVLLTHRQILSNVHVIIDSILTNYPETDGPYHCGVSWLPLYHDMGLIGCALTALCQPADLTLIPPELFVARPASWLRAISKYKATISPAPNFAYSLCVEKIKDKQIEGIDLSSWRLAQNGAEPVTPMALTRFVERFSKYGLAEQTLTPVYGLAEAALAVTSSEPTQRFRVQRFDRTALLQGIAKEHTDGLPLVSLGKPLPGYHVQIRKNGKDNCSQGEIGTVFIQGPSIMKEYFNNPQATQKALRDGWLDSGDTGFFFDDELYLYGREKDLIIVRGKNYAPQMIEQAAESIQGIRKGCTAAVGAPGENGDGEKLIVFVERHKQGAMENDTPLSEAVSRNTTQATGLIPDQVIVLDPGTLIRTSSGKIRRAETLRQFMAGILAPPKKVTLFSMATEMVRSHAAISSMSVKHR